MNVIFSCFRSVLFPPITAITPHAAGWRLRPSLEDIVDQVNGIPDVDATIAIGVTAALAVHRRRAALEDIVHNIDGVADVPSKVEV